MKTFTTVAALLEDPKRWCKGNLASDKDNNYIHPTDPGAVRWCLLGAIIKVYPIDSPSHDAAVRALRVAIHGEAVGPFNDYNPHATVLAVAKKAGI